MTVYRRRPRWTVKIRRPDYTRSTLQYQTVPEWSKIGGSVNQIEFVSSRERVNALYGYGDLIEYEYENTISNPSNPFSLSLVPRQDSKGRTWIDKIQQRDLVFIFEFEKLQYIGIVKSVGYSSSMSGENPNRSITIGGESLGGLAQRFDLPMNLYLWFNKSADSQTANQLLLDTLTTNINPGQTMQDVLSLIYERFLSVVFGAKTSGFAALINELMTLDASQIPADYPRNIKVFEESSNNLWNIFRKVLPPPVYEIFGRYNNGKYNVICRSTPFDFFDWYDLPVTKLNPVYLIDQNLNISDAEVFTQYYADMPNSVFTENQVYANTELQNQATFDEEKLAIYGYKQLRATFSYYDLDDDVSTRQKTLDFMKTQSKRLYAWYKNNNEFASGTITTHTVPDENRNLPNIGERLRYLEGDSSSIEFYIEGIKRKMSYPNTMTTTHTLTRGYEYGQKTITIDGESFLTPQVNKIANLGQKLIRAEKEIVREAGS